MSWSGWVPLNIELKPYGLANGTWINPPGSGERVDNGEPPPPDAGWCVAKRRELKRWIRVVHLDTDAVVFDFEHKGRNSSSMQDGVIDEFGGEQFHRLNDLGINALETGAHNLPRLGGTLGRNVMAIAHNEMVLVRMGNLYPNFRRLFSYRGPRPKGEAEREEIGRKSMFWPDGTPGGAACG
jgi:hypothetical protein